MATRGNRGNQKPLRVWSRGVGQHDKPTARAARPFHTAKKGVVARPPKQLY